MTGIKVLKPENKTLHFIILTPDIKPRESKEFAWYCFNMSYLCTGGTEVTPLNKLIQIFFFCFRLNIYIAIGLVPDKTFNAEFIGFFLGKSPVKNTLNPAGNNNGKML